MPIGMSRCGFLASCEAVETASKPIYAKNTTATPRRTPLQPKIPGPWFGGMNAPSGLLIVTQLCVSMNAKPATINATTIATLITTMTLLTLVDLVDSDDEKRRDRRDNEHGRNVEDGPGMVP